MSDEPKKIVGSPLIEPPKPIEQKTPEGWWHIDSKHAGHKTTKAEAIEAIKACEKTPAHWKAALLAEIESFDAKGIEVHAHCTPDKGRFVLQISLIKLF